MKKKDAGVSISEESEDVDDDVQKIQMEFSADSALKSSKGMYENDAPDAEIKKLKRDTR
jgi:hypothetical protein